LIPKTIPDFLKRSIRDELLIAKYPVTSAQKIKLRLCQTVIEIPIANKPKVEIYNPSNPANNETPPAQK
jgi:hypothetical protein